MSSKPSIRQAPAASPRKHRGVTMIESCVVLAIVAVLVASAAPAMQDLLDGRRLEGSATQLASDLQFVRMEAVARNQPLRLSVQALPIGRCYVIHSGDPGQCRCNVSGPAKCSGDAREVKTVQLLDQERVGLQSYVSSLLFDPVHSTSTPTGTLRLTGTRGRAIHHVLNIMGRVRSCSPLGNVPGYRSC